MKSNPVREKIAAGEPTYGGWLSIPSSVTAEAMSKVGFDWILIDLQHGLADFPTMLTMLQALSSSASLPLVRPPTNEAGIIGRALDAGARGVIIPMVNTAEDARAAVDACRYPPVGKRSYGPMRAAFDLGVDYLKFSDADALCIVMLETTEAFENMEEILATPGIDGAFVGPGDLNVSLGLPAENDNDNKQFNDYLAQAVAACKSRGLICGIYSEAEICQKRVQQGFNLVSVATDFGLLHSAAVSALETARS